MKAIVVAVAMVLVAACSTGSGAAQGTSHPTPPPSASAVPPTASDVVNALTSRGLPLINVLALTAADDPNQLLGRPHQYVAVTTWDDTRVQAAASPAAGNWTGKVEMFASVQDTVTRAKYLATITSSSPLFAEYEYESEQGQFIVRLNHAMTPDLTVTYLNALKARWPDAQAVS